MGLYDVIAILAYCTCINVATDLLSKRLVYGKDEYKESSETLERKTKQLQRLKEGGGGKKAAQHLAQVEQEVSNLKAAHGFKTMPAQVANMVVMISAIYILSTIFDGVVVARLPFEPVDTLGIRGFFHRGLKGEDYYEAGYLGFYILGNMLSRFAITKVAPNLSGAPKSVTAAAGNPFAALAEQWKENMEKVNAKYE